MDNEHSNDMEKNSSQPGKDTTPLIQEEIKADEKADISDGVPGKKPGAILAARRIEAGITEEQIAARLKMTLRQVHYLETDNYDALHGIAISRGFVRAYARVLQMDPEPLVAQFADRKISPSPVQVKASVKKTPELFAQNQMPFRKKRNFSGKLIILLVIVVIVAVVAWNMKLFSFDGRSGKKEVPETVVTGTAAPGTAPVVATTAPEPVSVKETSQNPEAGQTGGMNAEGVNAGRPADSGTAVNQNNGAAALPAVVKPETAKGVSEVSETKSSLLTMNFREKSWVQIQKKDGSVITEYMGKPGEQRQLEINEPVTVIIGYAPGVAMEFRGTAVDLAPSTINSVARISLK